MAYGAVLVGHLQTSAHSARISNYVVDAGDGTAIFMGDFVKTDGTTGSLTVAGENMPAVIQAAAGDTLRGFVVGVDPILGVAIGSENLNRLYRPASVQMVLHVCDDPYAVIRIQSSSAVAATEVGENADIVVSAGSTYTGMSGMQVSGTTGTSTAQLRILRVDASPNNVVGATNSDIICLINEHELKSTTGV